MRPSLRKIVIQLLLASVLAAACFSHTATAHPHVFARIRVELIFANGVLAGIRHTWTFDEMFSAFSISGLGSGKEPPTREQLAPLAKRYVESLKSYGYFTRITIDGQNSLPGDPVLYALTMRGEILELQFTLPIPPTAASNVTFSIFDPNYYVALSPMSEQPARLDGAPSNCSLSVRGAEQPKAVDESFFRSISKEHDWAAQFATVVDMTCS